MARIGGNITGVFQTYDGWNKNEIGEVNPEWVSVVNQKGFLDLMDGEARRTYLAKVEESTHIFISDFNKAVYSLQDKENVRVLCKGVAYDVLLIDNPMELNEHLEVYLKKVGAYDGRNIPG